MLPRPGLSFKYFESKFFMVDCLTGDLFVREELSFLLVADLGA